MNIFVWIVCGPHCGIWWLNADLFTFSGSWLSTPDSFFGVLEKWLSTKMSENDPSPKCQKTGTKMSENGNIRKWVQNARKITKISKNWASTNMSEYGYVNVIKMTQKVRTKMSEKWLSIKMSENGYENVSKFSNVTLYLCTGTMWFGYVTIF